LGKTPSQSLPLPKKRQGKVVRKKRTPYDFSVKFFTQKWYGVRIFKNPDLMVHLENVYGVRIICENFHRKIVRGTNIVTLVDSEVRKYHYSVTEPDEEITDDFDSEPEDEFNPDELDPNVLKDVEFHGEREPLTGKVPPFLARLQWWGFALLIAFIILVALRMIFGPPWVDRFRYQRLPVAIDARDNLIGILLPDTFNQPGRQGYHLILAGTDGKIRRSEKLGSYYGGPVDIALGKDSYYFIVGDGSWVAGRNYLPSESGENSDVDLIQFGMRIRNGIDLLDTDDSELMNVFNDDEILSIKSDSGLWEIYNRYSTKDWDSASYQIFDLSGYYAIASAGADYLAIGFPNFTDGFKKYNSEILLTNIQNRPDYIGESLYVPARIIPCDYINYNLDYLVLKNDRMFNLPYKYMDDQIFAKPVNSLKLVVFRHPYFNGKDIRGFAFISGKKENETIPADFVILYNIQNEFRLAALVLENPKPIWDISVSSVVDE
jgi:hypothetical protein